MVEPDRFKLLKQLKLDISEGDPQIAKEGFRLKGLSSQISLSEFLAALEEKTRVEKEQIPLFEEKKLTIKKMVEWIKRSLLSLVDCLHLKILKDLSPEMKATDFLEDYKNGMIESLEKTSKKARELVEYLVQNGRANGLLGRSSELRELTLEVLEEKMKSMGQKIQSKVSFLFDSLSNEVTSHNASSLFEFSVATKNIEGAENISKLSKDMCQNGRGLSKPAGLSSSSFVILLENGEVQSRNSKDFHLNWSKTIEMGPEESGFRNEVHMSSDFVMAVSKSLNIVHILKRETGDPVNKIAMTDPIGSASINNRNQILLGDILKGKLSFYDFDKGFKPPITCQINDYSHVSQCVGNDKFAVGTINGKLGLFSVADKPGMLWEIRPHRKVIVAMSVDSENKYIATGSYDNSCVLTNIKDSTVIWMREFGSNLLDVCFNKSGTSLLLSTSNLSSGIKEIAWVTTEDGKVLYRKGNQPTYPSFLNLNENEFVSCVQSERKLVRVHLEAILAK